jgi:hypothetical protein
MANHAQNGCFSPLGFVIRHLDFVIRQLTAISSPTVLCYILYCPTGEIFDVD